MAESESPKGIPAVLRFDGPLPAPQTYRPPADRIISGDPLQTAWNVFATTDERFNSGIWECQPGKWRVVFSESEFCQLLEGVLVVNGDDGTTTTFRAGDAFVTPAGFTGTWEVREKARKVYAFYE